MSLASARLAGDAVRGSGSRWTAGWVLLWLVLGSAAVCAENDLSHLSDAEAVTKMGQPKGISARSGSVRGAARTPAKVRSAERFLARRGWKPGMRPAVGLSLPGSNGGIFNLSDDKGVAKVGHPVHGLGNPDGRLTPLAAGGPAWVAAGPVGVNSLSYGLVTGRVSSVAFDPSDASGNHVFVGTTGGGLWQSQNAAAAPASVRFLPLTDQISALSGVAEAGISVGAVTVQPGATGVVLAGLGDPNDALDSYYGAGLLRSADGGKTWTLIAKTVDVETGTGTQDFSFVGEGFAGFAWSTTNVQIVVAAVSQAYEGTLVDSETPGQSFEGLYYSNDGGASWHLSRITDLDGEDVQGPMDDVSSAGFGNAATSVVWNPVRGVFLAAVRFHGYYQSPDGVTWTQLAAQPGTGLTPANCPTEPGGVGVAGCPIFRGSLAVNPLTGDTFAWTVDDFNQDQGIWQDQCAISLGSCTNQTIAFGVQLNTAALESSDDGGGATIANGDYNLSLAAVPFEQDTLLFAGDNDLWKCSLANSCAWRNTTNAETCMSAQVGEYQHTVAWDAGNPQLMFFGNDSGLWRSTDDVGETGPVCSASDATHVQNLNGSLGSLAEVVSLGQSTATAGTMLAGLGANGTAGVVNDPASTGGAAGDWNEVLGGEGGPVAVNPTSTINSWYGNNQAGVAIFHCSSMGLCTAAGFGTTPAIGEAQVGEDGLVMPYPASFLLDPTNASNVVIGTCRVWDGPANGSGWSAANAISPALDGTGGTACEGNALIGTLAALPVASGGESIYAGMAGAGDGGGVVAGHVFGGAVPEGGGAGTWTDLALSPVTNSSLGFNPYGLEVSSLYVDPHDTTGNTVYATIAGFSSVPEPMQQVYRTVDGGAHWTAITSNLPNAPANAIAVDPQDANTVYVALDTGVYVTRAVGTCGAASGTVACWAVYGTGLPESPVTQLAVLSSATGQVLTAGTYGRGVWQAPLVTSGTTTTSATVTPTSLAFNSQTVGTASATQNVVLKNTGANALTVSAVTMTGADPGDFAETDNCAGTVVAKTASCTLKVSFTPTATGARSASMAISGNLPGGQLLVPLTGTGLQTASVTLLPAGLSFGTQQIGTTSGTQSVSVQNLGGSPVTIASVTVTAPFTKVSTSCGSSLAANTSCAVTIAFAPTAAGAATGTLTVKDGVGTQSASLSGTGVTGPTDTLSTTTIAFPDTVIGQSSAPLAVQITNSGGLPLTGIGTSVSGPNGGDFIAISNCGGTLAAGSSCNVSVTFSPSVAAVETATLNISDALKSQQVKLTGTGKKPALISLSPYTIAFGSTQINVPTAAKTLTLTNAGGSPLANPSFSLSGPGAGNFVLGATTCTLSLLPQTSCTQMVTFDPVASGATTATLTVTSSSLGVAPANVALSGIGLSPPMVSVAPAQLNFGTVAVGGSSSLFTVVVTNTGQEPMNQPTFAVTGANATEFALSAPTDISACIGALNPGAICHEQITFSPEGVGARSATLTVSSSNAIPATATVGLSGTGAPLFQLQVSPASLSFPATPTGTTSATLTLTLSNLGKLGVNGLTLSLSGPYQLSSGATTCKSTLGAVSFCTIGVIFAPAASGNQPGLLTITISNLGGVPLTVPLNGTGVATGTVSVSPTQMVFGSVVVDQESTSQTLTVTNTGQAALAGMAVSVTGDYSLSGNDCTGSLGVGISCTTGVVLTPTTTGNRAGTLTVSSTSTAVAPVVVPLSGQGIPAGSLSAVPGVVNFGGVTVGQTSAPQTVTVSNVGATTLSGLQYLLAGDYSLTQNTCGAQIASGNSCTVTTTFSPGQPGTRVGAVTIQSPTTNGFTPLVIGLTGTGLPAASLMVTPSSLAFGSVMTGANSAAQQLTVQNPGTGTLTGLLIQTSSPYGVGSGSCGTTLAAGASCGAPVTFAPQVAGSQNGAVTISSTSLGVAAVIVPVTGTGVAAASLSVSPASLSFPATTVGGTSTSQSVTFSNPGGTALAGLTVTASGDFAITATSCTATLNGGASCAALVVFKPTVAGGRQGFVTAKSTTAGVASVSAALSGTGLTPAGLTVTPAELNFAPTLIGQVSTTQTATVTNGGQTAIADLALSVTAGFELDPAKTTCTAALAAGSQCTAGVLFAPVAAGVMTGSLTATSSAAPIPAVAALAGTGALPAGIVTSPAAVVTFGTTGIGQSAAPVTVTVTNSGTTAALTGLSLSVDAAGATDGFGLSANTCAALPAAGLAAGASCTANVTFTPTVGGRLTGTLALTSTSGASANLQLAGTGFNFTLTVLGTSTSTVIPGQTGYLKLAVTPLGGTSGEFTFQCANLPANAFCLFNPSQEPPLPANVTGNVALALTTGAPSTGTIPEVGASAGLGKKGSGGRLLLVCGLLLLPLPLAWRARRYRWLVSVALLAALVGVVTSCAGSHGSGGNLHYGGGTPAGTYSIPITATSDKVSHSYTVTLVVD